MCSKQTAAPHAAPLAMSKDEELALVRTIQSAWNARDRLVDMHLSLFRSEGVRDDERSRKELRELIDQRPAPRGLRLAEVLQSRWRVPPPRLRSPLNASDERALFEDACRARGPLHRLLVEGGLFDWTQRLLCFFERGRPGRDPDGDTWAVLMAGIAKFDPNAGTSLRQFLRAYEGPLWREA